MKVSDIMTKGVVSVETSSSIATAAEVMRANGIGSVLVSKANMIEGIVSELDIVLKAVAKGHDPNSIQAGEIMTAGLITCSEDQSVDDALSIMRDQSVHHLVVLNKAGNAVGMLSLGDILLSAVPAGSKK